MWPFTKKLEDIIASRDIPALLKRYLKKMGDRRVQDAVEQFAGDVWNYAYASWRTKDIDEMQLMFLSMLLKDRNLLFAGDLAVTPVEFWSRMSSALDRTPKQPEAICPACSEYLSQKIEKDLVRYRVCSECCRRYHSSCSTGLAACSQCGGTNWAWDVRKHGHM